MCLSAHNNGEKRAARASEDGWRTADTAFILSDDSSPIEGGQRQDISLPTSVTLTAALAHKPFFASLKSFHPSSETKYIDICTVGQYGEAWDQAGAALLLRALHFFNPS